MIIRNVEVGTGHLELVSLCDLRGGTSALPAPGFSALAIGFRPFTLRLHRGPGFDDDDDDDDVTRGPGSFGCFRLCDRRSEVVWVNVFPLSDKRKSACRPSSPQ